MGRLNESYSYKIPIMNTDTECIHMKIINLIKPIGNKSKIFSNKSHKQINKKKQIFFLYLDGIKMDEKNQI